MSAEAARGVQPLLGPVALGGLTLRNRIVMAPMTRNRAGSGDAPGELAAAYYGARAGAGLIITEGTQPSKHGKGYTRTPGLYTAEQLAGWQRVTDAVHAGGGSIVLQMMHCGRIASHHNKEPDARTVAPSALRASGRMFTDAAGLVEFDTPEELSPEGIRATIGEYAQSARAAQLAGFDGVELHAASGYLPMQFLSTGTNQRRDGYGGTLARRLRFTVELLETLGEVWGPECVGLRICPGNPFNDLHDEDPLETYEALLRTVAHDGPRLPARHPLAACRGRCLRTCTGVLPGAADLERRLRLCLRQRGGRLGRGRGGVLRARLHRQSGPGEAL